MAKTPPQINLHPSSADRWTTCTASPKFIFDNWDKLPDDDSSKYSLEGNSAHEVAAAYLQNRKPDLSKCPVPIDADMRWHGWNYAEYVMGLMKPEGTLLVEQKLPLWYAEGRNAYVDAAVLNPDGLHVIDYKYGEGVPVYPENNLQAIIYARCVMLHSAQDHPDGFPVTVHIYQPRARNVEDSPVHTWETDFRDIRQRGADIFFQAKDILNSADLVFAPSEKACHFCPAKGFCPERQRALTSGIEALAVIEQPKQLPPVQAISKEQLCAILTHKEQIAKWLNDAEEYALSCMKSGTKLPGFKLVTSRGGNRYWSDPKKAEKILLGDTMLRRSEVVEEKIISPGAAEKLLGKNKFSAELSSLIAKTPGQLVIAPADDKREEYLAITGASEFEKL